VPIILTGIATAQAFNVATIRSQVTGVLETADFRAQPARHGRAGQWLDLAVARRSGEPLARLRLTGNAEEVALLYPSHRGGREALGDFGVSTMPLDDALQCLSANPYFLELWQTYG
jgi:hypothetical protein